jgi:hypothetical protein
MSVDVEEKLAGEVWRRRVRQTRRLAILIDRENGGDWVDGDFRYQLLCVEHGGLLDSETRYYAERMVADMHEWCEACRDADGETRDPRPDR